ncbi:hypothetical protein B0A49_09523 [Cryomyces minteri]|uniref:Uncharacterized protein n=1 Tax=Cryomyces minteri TaxID=331657 RepID=A0A4U0WGW5_9PEZI|nr:hypothetical protein B0A49_09523 [Cryomyces minteri]
MHRLIRQSNQLMTPPAYNQDTSKTQLHLPLPSNGLVIVLQMDYHAGAFYPPQSNSQHAGYPQNPQQQPPAFDPQAQPFQLQLPPQSSPQLPQRASSSAYPPGSTAGNGLFASGRLMTPADVQNQYNRQQNPYTSVPFGETAPTSAATAPQQQLQLQPILQPSKSMSMAAPSLPPYQAQGQSVPQSTTKPIPQRSLSPGAQARERERVSVILDINSDILHEAIRLQEEGKGGLTGSDVSADQNGADAKLPAMEYIDCMRRLQANLAYLAATVDAHHKTNSKKIEPTGPAIMEASPTHSPDLVEKYGQLQKLFPGWKGLQWRMPPSASNAGGSQNAQA